MAEMNVVPWIDVMLVLLVIFMITAPLLTQGVKVELPRVPSEVLPPTEDEPLIVSVDREGKYYLTLGDDPEQALEPEALLTRVAALRKYKPAIQVLVRGDAETAYGRVVTLMAMLQGAGVDSVGLMTEPADGREER
jgi:biopolymer transport protein TolR